MGCQVPSLTPCNTFHLDSHHISRGRQGPRGRQVPSLTPCDTLRPDGPHISIGRQVPFLTSRDTFCPDGCHVSRGCHLWVVRYLHWHHVTHSALTIITYQWIVRDQGVVKVCASFGWTCQLRTRQDELLIWLPWSIWESVLHIWLHMYLMDGHVLSSIFIPTDGWSYWRFSNWVP